MNKDIRDEEFGEYIKRIYANSNLLIPSITLQVCDYCSLACTYCVAGDTLITMADGSFKSIRDIVIGDTVLGFTVNDGAIEEKPAKVLNTFIHKSNVFKVEDIYGKSLTITGNHKVLSGKGEFEPIGNSDCIRVYVKVNNSFISHILYKKTPLDGEIDVYNIETETGTYIANDFLVHNCYQINKKNHVMDISTAKLFIDKLLTDEDNFVTDYFHKPLDGIILDFIGGEPFLQTKLINDICDYFYNKCFELNKLNVLEKSKFSFSSNGVHYFEPEVQAYLNKYKDKISFSISIDGNKELHDKCRVFPDGRGSYDIAMSAVKHWREHGGHMGSKMTLAPANIMYTFEATKSMIENGYTDIHMNCVFEKGWLPEHATILYYELKNIADYVLDNDLEDKLNIDIFDNIKYVPLTEEHNECYCGGNGKMLAIDYKGDLYPCVRYMESCLDDDTPAVIIGNVYTGFMKNKSEIDIVKKIQALNRKNYSPEECYNCPINGGCANCIACDYMYNKDFTVRTTFSCEMHKASALANVYYWNKFYKKKNLEKYFQNYVPDEWALKIINEKELKMLKELCERK